MSRSSLNIAAIDTLPRVDERNPVTTLAGARRVRSGYSITPPVAGDAWSVAHQAACTLRWIAGIVTVRAPLVVHADERSVAT